MNNNKKRIIHLVPHSHWDREWYFTYDTSNVLYHNAMQDLITASKARWFLDGQWSLIDDYLKWNRSQKPQIIKALKSHNICSGPLYTQPDVFNTLGETIIRNFKVGARVAKRLGIKQSLTAYLPDTFGFGANFPNLLRHVGMKNFVFWRGAPEQIIQKDLRFQWEGLDGSQVQAYILKGGYFPLGGHYPYNNGIKNPLKMDFQHFSEKVLKQVGKLKMQDQEIFLPLGGDQAPLMWNQEKIVLETNKLLKDYEIKIACNFDDLFKIPPATDNHYQGELRTPISGKIHRTITSSREDIKALFRKVEERLYHVLEPLEVLYAQIDNDYDFREFKEENIVKPLLIASAHDSLGACNTDIVNNHQLIRIQRILENINSQIDLLLKKLIEEEKQPQDIPFIFNPYFNNNHGIWTQKIYSRNANIDHESQHLIIKSIGFQEISLKNDKPLYKHEALVIAKNLKPLTIQKVESSAQKSPLIKSKIKLPYPFNLKLKNQDFKLEFEAYEELGDSYDSSPGDLKEIVLNIENTFQYKVKDYRLIRVQGSINNSAFKLDILEDDNIWFNFKINNKMKNTKLSLKITPQNSLKVKRSLNLALQDPSPDDVIPNWQEKFDEYPTNSQVNDGIIQVSEDLSVITSGNNEFFIDGQSISITLFRTYPFVTNKNLASRPSTSGLSWFEASEDAQLQKELKFKFVFTNQNPIKVLNRAKHTPSLYFYQNRNFIAHKMTKFMVNNILNKNKQAPVIPTLVSEEIYLSAVEINKNIFEARVANMTGQQETAIFKVKNKQWEFKLKKYEIKKIKINLGDA